MLSVENKPIMLSVILLNVIMLSVVMLNVMAPTFAHCEAEINLYNNGST